MLDATDSEGRLSLTDFFLSQKSKRISDALHALYTVSQKIYHL